MKAKLIKLTGYLGAISGILFILMILIAPALTFIPSEIILPIFYGITLTMVFFGGFWLYVELK